MYLRKSFGQYLPILFVYGLVLASFIDYIFNYCCKLIIFIYINILLLYDIYDIY